MALTAPVIDAWDGFVRISGQEDRTKNDDDSGRSKQHWFASAASAGAYHVFASEFLAEYECSGCCGNGPSEDAEFSETVTGIIHETSLLLSALGKRLANRAGGALTEFEQAALPLSIVGSEAKNARSTALLVIRVFATALRCDPLSGAAPRVLLMTPKGSTSDKNMVSDTSAALLALTKYASTILLSRDDGLAGNNNLGASTASSSGGTSEGGIHDREESWSQRSAFGRALCLATTQVLASVCPALPRVSAAFAAPGLPAHPWSADILSAVGMPLDDTHVPPEEPSGGSGGNATSVLRQLLSTSALHPTNVPQTVDSQHRSFTSLVEKRLQRQRSSGLRREVGSSVAASKGGGHATAASSARPLSSSTDGGGSGATTEHFSALVALTATLVRDGVMEELVNILRVAAPAGTTGKPATFLACFQTEVLVLTAALISSVEERAGSAFTAAGGLQAVHDLLRLPTCLEPTSLEQMVSEAASAQSVEDSEGGEKNIRASEDGILSIAHSERFACALALCVLEESTTSVHSDEEERKVRSRVRLLLETSFLPAAATALALAVTTTGQSLSEPPPLVVVGGKEAGGAGVGAPLTSSPPFPCLRVGCPSPTPTHQRLARALHTSPSALSSTVNMFLASSSSSSVVSNPNPFAAVSEETLRYTFCPDNSKTLLQSNGLLARLFSCLCVLACSERRPLPATITPPVVAHPSLDEGSKGASMWVSSLFGFGAPPQPTSPPSNPSPILEGSNNQHQQRSTSTTSSPSSSSSPNCLSFLQPVLRCFASLNGVAADGDEIPIVPLAVLVCVSRLLEYALEDTVGEGAQADTWTLVFGFLRGGRRSNAKFAPLSPPTHQQGDNDRADEDEEQQQQQSAAEKSNMDAVSNSENIKCNYYELKRPASTATVVVGRALDPDVEAAAAAARAWACVHDDSLQVLHRVVLTASAANTSTAASPASTSSAAWPGGSASGGGEGAGRGVGPSGGGAGVNNNSSSRFPSDLRRKIVTQVARCLKHYATAGGGDRLTTLRCCRWLRSVLCLAAASSTGLLLMPPLSPSWQRQGTGAEAVATVAKLLLQTLQAHKPITTRPLATDCSPHKGNGGGGAAAENASTRLSSDEGQVAENSSPPSPLDDWPLHESLLGLLYELASGPGRDTVLALVCSRGNTAADVGSSEIAKPPLKSQPASRGGSSSSGKGQRPPPVATSSPSSGTNNPPPLPYLDALLDFASSPFHAPTARRMALHVVARLLTHSAARAAPAVRRLALSSASEQQQQQQHEQTPQQQQQQKQQQKQQRSAPATESAKRAQGIVDADFRGAEFALQRGRAMALRVLQTLASCFEANKPNAVAVGEQARLTIALELIDCLRLLLSTSGNATVVLSGPVGEGGGGEGPEGGGEVVVSVAVAEALQLFFRQVGGIRTLVDIAAALACDRRALSTPAAAAAAEPEPEPGSPGYDTDETVDQRHSEDSSSGDMKSREASLKSNGPSPHAVVCAVFATCTAMMRNRGDFHIGDRNRVSFRKALHALPLLSMDEVSPHGNIQAETAAAVAAGHETKKLGGGGGGGGGSAAVSAVNHIIVLSPLLPLLLRLEGGCPSGPLIALLFDMLFADGRIANALDANVFDSTQVGDGADDGEGTPSFDSNLFLQFVKSAGEGGSDGVQSSTSLSSPASHLFTMQHHELVPVLVFLLPHAPLGVRVSALELMRWLLAKHPTAARSHQVVCASLVQPPLLTALLDVFNDLGDAQTEAIRLATALGQHNVTVAQLKRMFRLMNAHRGFRPQHSWRLVKSLREMVSIGGVGTNDVVALSDGAEEGVEEEEGNGGSGGGGAGGSGGGAGTSSAPDVKTADFHLSWRRRGPHRYFLFDGAHSGLRLPQMPRWPASKGYTFSTWFRVESMATGAASSSSAAAPAASASSSASAASPGSKVAQQKQPAVGSGSTAGEGRGGGGEVGALPNDSQAGSNSYQPVLFSFKCRSGNGIEVSLVEGSGPGKYSIALTVYSRKKGPPLCRDLRERVEVCEGEWRFIAVSHTRSQFRTVSSVEVVVDSESFFMDLSFPRFDANIRGCIGRRPYDNELQEEEDAGFTAAGRRSNSERGSDNSINSGKGRDGSVLHGQMGAVYFFDEALPVDKLRSIYALGPNYTYFFERASIDLRHHDDDRVDMDPNTEPALDGSLTSHLMLAYNPSVHEGDAFLDNTPEKNSVSWGSNVGQLGFGNLSALYGLGGDDGALNQMEEQQQQLRFSVYRDKVQRPMAGHMHALRLPGTVECVTRDVRNTLDCLGGVQVLFPLFAQFDQPVLVERKSHGGGGGGGGGGNSRGRGAAAATEKGDGAEGADEAEEEEKKVDFSTEPKLTEWVLNLLGTLVDRNSAANESFLAKHGAFQMVGFFLEKVSPQHLTIPALEAMRRLTTCARWSNTNTTTNSSRQSDDLFGGSGTISPHGLAAAAAGSFTPSAAATFRTSAVRHLLANWSLWVFTEEEVQRRLSLEFVDMASNKSSKEGDGGLAPLLRSTVTLQWMLDGMGLFFWYKPPTMLIDDYDLLFPAPPPPPPKVWPPPPPAFAPPSPMSPSKSDPIPPPMSLSGTLLPPMPSPSPLLRGSSFVRVRSSTMLNAAAAAAAAAATTPSRRDSAFSKSGSGEGGAAAAAAAGGPASSAASVQRPWSRPSRGVVRRLVRPLLARESLHPTTREVAGRRARKETLVQVRKGLWAATEAVLMSSHSAPSSVRAAVVAMNEEEACALLGFITRAEEDESRCEALGLLVRLVTHSHDHAVSFANALAAIVANDDGDGGLRNRPSNSGEATTTYPLQVPQEKQDGSGGGGGDSGSEKGGVSDGEYLSEATGGATQVGCGLLLLLSLLRPAHSVRVRVYAFLLIVRVANIQLTQNATENSEDGSTVDDDDDSGNDDNAEEGIDQFGTPSIRNPAAVSLFGAGALSRRAVFTWISSQLTARRQNKSPSANVGDDDGEDDMSGNSESGILGDDDEGDVGTVRAAAEVFCDGLQHLLLGKFCDEISQEWAGTSAAAEGAASQRATGMQGSPTLGSTTPFDLVHTSVRLPNAFTALCSQLAQSQVGGRKRSLVLHRLKALLSRPANRNAILDEPEWQKHLLLVAAAALETTVAVGLESDERDASISPLSSSTNNKHACSGEGSSASWTSSRPRLSSTASSNRSSPATNSRQLRSADYVVDIVCTLLFHSLTHANPPGARRDADRHRRGGDDDEHAQSMMAANAKAKTVKKGGDFGPPPRAADAPPMAEVVPEQPRPSELAPLLATLNGLRQLATQQTLTKTTTTTTEANDCNAAANKEEEDEAERVSCTEAAVVEGQVATRIGCEVLLGLVVRLRREMEVLSSRRSQWFDISGPVNSPVLWSSTVGVVWHTVAAALEFIVAPPGTAAAAATTSTPLPPPPLPPREGARAQKLEHAFDGAVASVLSPPAEAADAAVGTALLPEPLSEVSIGRSSSSSPGDKNTENGDIDPVVECIVDLGFVWPLVEELLNIIEPASNTNTGSPLGGVVETAEVKRTAEPPQPSSSSDGQPSLAHGSSSDEMPTASLFTNSSPNDPSLVFLGGLVPCAPQTAMAFSIAGGESNDGENDDVDDAATFDSNDDSRHAFSVSALSSFSSADPDATNTTAAETTTMASEFSLSFIGAASLPSPPASPHRRWRQRQQRSSSTSSVNSASVMSEGLPPSSLESHAHLPWVLLRLLLNIASLGSECRAPGRGLGFGAMVANHEEKEMPSSSAEAGRASERLVVAKPSDPSVPIRALQRLELLLDQITIAQGGSAAATGLEVVFVVGTLVTCLRQTSLPASSEWSVHALRCVRSLSIHTHYHADLCDAFANDGEGGSAGVGRLPDLNLAGTSEAAVLALMTTLFQRPVSSTNENVATEEIDKREERAPPETSSNSSSSSSSSSSSGGPWDCWDESTAQDLAEMAATEARYSAALSATVSAGALAAAQGAAALTDPTKRCSSALDERVKWAVLRVKQDEGCRLVEGLLDAERERRHGEHQWGRVREGLASERGPWGYAVKSEGGALEDGNDDDDDAARKVYWMMDSSEDHLRCRHKLTRNPLGSSHTGAGQHSNAQAAAAAAASEKAKAATAKVWKSLTRFQKKSELGSTETDEDGEEGDGDGGEEAAEKKGGTVAAAEAEDDEGVEDEEDMVARRAREDAEEEEEDARRHNGVVGGTLFNAPVELLARAPLVMTPGTLEVTRERIRFTRVHDEDFDLEDSAAEGSHGASSSNSSSGGQAAGVGSGGYDEAGYKWAIKQTDARTWRTRDVIRLSFRHYSLRFVAMEIFFADHSVIMLNLKTAQMCRNLYDTIANRCRPPYFEPEPDSPRKVLARSRVHGSIGLTDAWVQREITNFEYLMRLNTIAGRTYNDLAQYPIFPWVLADYTSAELDLSQPRTFRDLRYPIGVQHGRARVELQERYRELESITEENDPLSAPFHYGCCYSNPAFVLWYLLRLEPFSSLHIHLNDGHFDKPDRMFQSIGKAYRGCTTNPTDVKELIPEFFYQPEFLRNASGMDLGTTQDGQRLGNVVLPPWAKGDVGRFVRMHRLALESEFVSANLHHWVDLIFGNKQRPPAMINGSPEAVKACNVYRFYHYPDAFSMEEVEAEDPHTHEVWVKTANEFGQVPVQLFPKQAHPQRIPLHQADIIWPIASVVPGAGTCLYKQPEPQRPNYLLSYPPRRVAGCAVIMLAEVGGGAERLVTIDAVRVIGYHIKERRPPDVVPPYKLKIDTYAFNLSTSIMRGNVSSSWSSSSSAVPSSATPASMSSAPTNTRARSASDGFLLRSSNPSPLTSSLPSASVPTSASSVLAATGTVRERRLGVPFAPLRSLLVLRQPNATFSSKSNNGVPSISSSSGDSQQQQQQQLEAWPLRVRLDSKDLMGKDKSGVRVVVASAVSDDLSDPTFAVDSTKEPSSGNTTTSVASTSNTLAAAAAALQSSVRSLPNPSPAAAKSPPWSSSTNETTTSGVDEEEAGVGGGDGVVDDELGPHLFAVHGKLLFSCKHWDSSFKVTHLETGRLLQSVALHHDVLTCLHVCSEGPRSWLVTASCDCTVMVWEIDPSVTGHVVSGGSGSGSGSGCGGGSNSGTISGSTSGYASNEQAPVNPTPIHTLTGHDDAVTCVAASPQLDMVVSASQDSVVVHTLYNGTYVRTIDMLQHSSSSATSSVNNGPPSTATTAPASDIKGGPLSSRRRGGSAGMMAGNQQQGVDQEPVLDKGVPVNKGGPAPRIHWVGISQQGYILTYSRDDCSLCSFEVNGTLLRRESAGEQLHAFLLSEDGKVLLTGGRGRKVVWRWVHDLSLANDGPRKGFAAMVDGSCEQHKVPAFPAPIRSIAMSEHERHLMVGLENGLVYMLAPDSNYLRQRLQKQLEYLGFY